MVHAGQPMGLRPSALTVAGPASGTVTKPLTLFATLIGAGTTAPTGTPLDIARENPVTGAVTPLGTVYTDGNGVAAFTDQVVTVQAVPVSAPLRVTYYVKEPTTLTVTYQGNAVQAPASASINVQPVRVRS